MFGGVNQDSFGANWGFRDLNQYDDNVEGGFLDEDVSNFITDDLVTKNKSENVQKKTFMPLKISMIYNAWKSGGSFLNVFGYQLEIIKIVGRIKETKSTDQETTFVVDDGSGKIDCIYMHPGDISEWRKRFLSNLDKNKQQVKIYGGFNPIYSTQVPTIIIYSIKELNSPDESTLHDLDVINAILLSDGKHNPDALNTLNEMDAILKQFDIVQPFKTDTGASITSANIVASAMEIIDGKVPANELALTKYISSMLANETRNHNPNGLHISEILKRCKQQHSFQSILEQHVRKVLTDLERDATVYQTLDSNTFASTDS